MERSQLESDAWLFENRISFSFLFEEWGEKVKVFFWLVEKQRRNTGPEASGSKPAVRPGGCVGRATRRQSAALRRELRHQEIKTGAPGMILVWLFSTFIYLQNYFGMGCLYPDQSWHKVGPGCSVTASESDLRPEVGVWWGRKDTIIWY